MGFGKKRKFIFIDITASVRKARNLSESIKEVDAVQLVLCLVKKYSALRR